MAVPMPNILQPPVVNAAVSELKLRNTRLSNFYASGGTAQQTGRNFAWDYFNASREVAGGRAPGTGPAKVARQKIGNVSGEFPRVHESLNLLYEQIHNLRQVGGTAIDKRGENYIMLQETYLAQRVQNHKEMQWAGLSRGKYYYSRSGDDLVPSLDSGTVTIDFQVPAGNKDDCDMLGEGSLIDGPWSSASTNIPAQLANINAALNKLSGYDLEHVWLNASDWQNVLNNTKVKDQAGTSNTAFESLVRDAETGDMTARLKCLPWLTFHITAAVLNFAGTRTELIPAGRALMCPTPSPDWVQLGEGSEVVVEYPGATPTEQYGTYFYAEPCTKPAGYELISVCNQIPYLYIPSNIIWADITTAAP